MNISTTKPNHIVRKVLRTTQCRNADGKRYVLLVLAQCRHEILVNPRCVTKTKRCLKCEALREGGSFRRTTENGTVFLETWDNARRVPITKMTRLGALKLIHD